MKNYIQQIIDLFANNEYSLSTRRKVQQWLVKEEHVEEKEKALHLLWSQAGEQKVPCGMKQSIRQMQRNIGVRTAETNRIYQLRIWRAVAVVLLAVSSISVFLMLEKERPQKDLIECYIPAAEINELTLPDGTYVMLNSKSTLLYPEQFDGKTRSVYLIGEANFKVKSDKEHPFIVKANDCQITALGTEFNVNAYPENDELIATLLEGSVKIEFNNLMSNIILKPNEQFIYSKKTKSHSLYLPQIGDVTAWQRGELVFSNMCLEDIFTNLERKFPYTFVYSLHSLNKNTYSFRFQKQASLKEVIEIIAQVVGEVKYTIKGNKCYITNK
ncbi:MAG: FecR domain-containing protein [Bacteroides sp.]|uniref:FecR family protein n=1 Tax=Bacteroides sp. TaxID=29523 RepID=UPI002FC775D6